MLTEELLAGCEYACKREQFGNGFNNETGFPHIRFGKAAQPSETHI